MAEPDKAPRRFAKKVRCAIYTRKSTDEGLEQAFNSLDAQREACAAFIQSQRHEGWLLVPALYDDGGYSGGSLERPALKQLLADIQTGQIDVVVVYKVDRLTRALSDFAKLVDIFTSLQRLGSGASAGSGQTAPNMAAKNCRVAHSISCCRIGFTAATSLTKAIVTPEIIWQSLNSRCGPKFRQSSPPTGSNGQLAHAPSTRACSQAYFLMTRVGA